jgi:hypothetical protein
MLKTVCVPPQEEPDSVEGVAHPKLKTRVPPYNILATALGTPRFIYRSLSDVYDHENAGNAEELILQKKIVDFGSLQNILSCCGKYISQ